MLCIRWVALVSNTSFLYFPAQTTATVDPDLLRKSDISEADMGVLSRNLRALALEGLPDTRK
jgi:hypothetical protein